MNPTRVKKTTFTTIEMKRSVFPSCAAIVERELSIPAKPADYWFIASFRSYQFYERCLSSFRIPCADIVPTTPDIHSIQRRCKDCYEKKKNTPTNPSLSTQPSPLNRKWKDTLKNPSTPQNSTYSNHAPRKRTSPLHLGEATRYLVTRARAARYVGEIRDIGNIPLSSRAPRVCVWARLAVYGTSGSPLYDWRGKKPGGIRGAGELRAEPCAAPTGIGKKEARARPGGIRSADLVDQSHWRQAGGGGGWYAK